MGKDLEGKIYYEIRHRNLLAVFMYFDVSPYISIKPYTINV